MTMMADTRGIAVRLVMMKYFGKVLKRNQTSGAVNVWHDIVNAVSFHSFFKGSWPLETGLSGYHDDRTGYRTTMPAMARYDNWNPKLSATCGFTAT